jgi:hypothetical protein
MEAVKTMGRSHAILQQTHNNATFWIGNHRGDHKDHYAGQTFVSPEDGELDSIEIYSTAVTSPCKVTLSLHSFDAEHKRWGPVLQSLKLELNGEDSGKWIRFDLQGVHLNKGNAYGFRLQTNNALVGVGEAAGSSKFPPFNNGQEWSASSENKSGHFYTYFSLMFKVEMMG